MPILPPQTPGYNYFLHRRHEDEYGDTGPRTTASGLIVSPDHCGTHIDAPCHQADDLVLCGGVSVSEAQTASGFSSGGAEEIPPIVSPAVLLDVPASKGLVELEELYQVTVEDLQACCEHQGTSVEAGDVVLVRTGGGRYWSTDARRYLGSAGVSGGASQWLAERGVYAVGADNVAWDIRGVEDPELGVTMPGHLILLARRGVYILENLGLEQLAAAGVHRFTLVCAVPSFEGATGAPVRPLAFVEI
jgi:kynurenine formamidase